MICIIGNHKQNNNMEYRQKSVLFFCRQRDLNIHCQNIGHKKRPHGSSRTQKIIKKYKNPLTTQNNHDTIQDG